MKFRFALFVMCVLAALVPAAFADEHAHFDVSPVLIDGKIATEGITHMVGGQRWWSPARRVFEYEFGEDPLFPRRSDDPGINREPGTVALDPDGNSVVLGSTGLPAGSILYITFTDDLRYWTGDGFGPVPGGETLTFTFGDTRTVGTGTGRLDPLPIHLFGSDSLHYHLVATLYGPPGNPSSPAPGVYLVSAVLESSSPGVEQSDTFWMVYGYQASEEDHQAAAAWVEANLVPEPGIVATIWFLGMFMLRRRGR